MSEQLRTVCVIALLLVPVFGVALGQDSKRIALTDKSDVPTADILKGLHDHCPSVSIVNDANKSDFTLEAIARNRLYQGTTSTRFDLTLFDRDGKAVFSTSTREIGNAVKDVCKAIGSSTKKESKE